MTIKRMYSLPNCQLILEGLSINDAAPEEGRPLLSLLVNAECRLSPMPQPLVGGRDFLESLVTAVSAYAQEFLSKVPHPVANHKQQIVELQQVDSNRHRLIFHPEQKLSSDEANTNLPPVQVDLTTVQLFDLVEAVDQFFADKQTLPDLSLRLVPVSKRQAGTSKIKSKQAVPAVLGVSSLALAAVAFFFVPNPPRRIPQLQPQYNHSLTTPASSQPKK